MSDISVSNPQARRTSTRRTNLKKKWTGKQWKVAREGFIKSHGSKCEWCGHTDHLTVHHPQRNSYGDDVYLDFGLSECILLCRQCHAAVHAGRSLCERNHEDGENHYRWHDAAMCGVCFLKEHPEIIQKRKESEQKKRDNQKAARKIQSDKVKAWKKAHPKVKK
jgi:hypothetical protein